MRKSPPVVSQRERLRSGICGVILASTVTLAGCNQSNNAEPSSGTSTPLTASTTVAGKTPRSPSPGEYPSEPTGGDQASAEIAVKQGYAKKLADCYATHNAVANVVEINWLDFRDNQEAAGIIRDANPGLGGNFKAKYEDGRWYIEYAWC